MFKYFFIFCTLFLLNSVFAQTEAKLKPGYFSNVTDEFKSPLLPQVKPWLISGVATTVLLLVFEDQTIDPVQNEAKEDRPLGKYNRLGDLGGTFLPNALYTAGMLGNYWLFKNETSLKRSGLMLKASLYAIAVSSTLKVTVREPRPNKMDRYSFPSGHATSAFAFASFIVAEHGFFPFGLLATSLASLTALSRMTDSFHYLHDVIAGATIGTAYGLGISYLHKNSSGDESTTTQKNSIVLVPVYSLDRKALLFSMDF